MTWAPTSDASMGRGLWLLMMYSSWVSPIPWFRVASAVPMSSLALGSMKNIYGSIFKGRLSLLKYSVRLFRYGVAIYPVRCGYLSVQGWLNGRNIQTALTHLGFAIVTCRRLIRRRYRFLDPQGSEQFHWEVNF